MITFDNMKSIKLVMKTDSGDVLYTGINSSLKEEKTSTYTIEFENRAADDEAGIKEPKVHEHLVEVMVSALVIQRFVHFVTTENKSDETKVVINGVESAFDDKIINKIQMLVELNDETSQIHDLGHAFDMKMLETLAIKIDGAVQSKMNVNSVRIGLGDLPDEIKNKIIRASVFGHVDKTNMIDLEVGFGNVPAEDVQEALDSFGVEAKAYGSDGKIFGSTSGIIVFSSPSDYSYFKMTGCTDRILAGWVPIKITKDGIFV